MKAKRTTFPHSLNACFPLRTWMTSFPVPYSPSAFHLSDHSTKASDSMPLKLHAIEDWSRKRLVSELGSARFNFDPPMNLGSRSTYLILSSPLSSVRIACFLPLSFKTKNEPSAIAPSFLPESRKPNPRAKECYWRFRLTYHYTELSQETKD